VIYKHTATGPASDSFAFTVSNNAGGTISYSTFDVAITPVNHPPSTISLLSPSVTLPENTANAAGLLLINFSVTDDGIGTNTLSLCGPDAASFSIQGSSLWLRPGVALDSETKNVYNVTVNVDATSVGATPDASTDFTLNVSDVNEAPTVSLL